MRSLFLCVAVFFSSLFCASAQITISNEVLGTLNEATGRQLLPDGKWLSRKGKIPLATTEKGESKDETLGLSNFQRLELRKGTVDGQECLVLIQLFTHGSFIYPELREGWSNRSAVSFYIVPTSFLSSFDSLQNGTAKQVRTQLLRSRFEIRCTPETYLEDIRNSLAKVGENAPHNFEQIRFLFNIYVDKSKNTVKFLFTSESRSKYLPKPNYSLYFTDQAEIYSSVDVLKQAYFETPLDQFSKFIPVKVQ